MTISLITTAWGHGSSYPTESPLLKSFAKHNPGKPVIYTYRDRNDYAVQEHKYAKFGNQSEYVLYKVDLLRESVKLVETPYIVFADYNDVVCFDKVDSLVELFDLNSSVVFSSERNVYPKSVLPAYQYSAFDKSHSWHLNSGVILAKTELFVKLLDKVIDVYVKGERTIQGGDQGLYTMFYNSGEEPRITLDYANLFALSTYDSNIEDYYVSGGRIWSKRYRTSPVFVHENGYNYGNPKFLKKFNLDIV